MRDDDDSHTSIAYQLQYMTPSQKFFVQKSYWTDTDIRDHDAVKVNGKVVAGVHEWETVKINLDPRDHEYELQTVPGTKKKVYEVWWRLSLDCKGAHVAMRWEILEAGTQPFDCKSALILTVTPC